MMGNRGDEGAGVTCKGMLPVDTSFTQHWPDLLKVPEPSREHHQLGAKQLIHEPMMGILY